MPKPVQASSYTFRNIIEGGFVYVDKTRYLYELVRYNTGIYFLARPRRFGKSLMISTLNEIFQGNKALFKGLWLYDSDYNWQSYPIIRIDFSRHRVKDAETLEQVLDYFVEGIAEENGITLRGFDYQSRFDNLIQQLGRESKVVILIDEYDRPLLDNLTNIPEAIKIRDVLRNFYAIIKAMDEYIRFVFMTGISKFSKVGVFSTLNHLDDLSMSPKFATALGITEEELTGYFSEHIAEIAHDKAISESSLLDEMRQWYDGFCFVENCESVYNPFSALRFLEHGRFSNYWFETGTPTFLVNLLKDGKFPIEELDDLHLSELGFSTYEVEDLSALPLLFQTGYLTIKEYDPATQRYLLTYPNTEVRDAFITHLLGSFSHSDFRLNDEYLSQLVDALRANDLETFFTILNVFFANVPYDIHLKYEKYYQTIFYLIFKLLGVQVDAEVKTNRGRIDAVIELPEHIYLFEFKLDGSAKAALDQIQKPEYVEKYRLSGKPITMVGANFDSGKRKVVDWDSEPSQA